MPEIMGWLARERNFASDPERVAFAMVLQRLCCPDSDLQGAGWVKGVEAGGLDGMELQHLYRTTGFLADVREELEWKLFSRDRDLFSQSLDLVFIDTTSIYTYRGHETEWWVRGCSRDHRSDLPQLVLAVCVDRNGWSISWEVFPGNRADKRALETMLKKLRERFRIGRVIIVADRGMVSQKAIADLTEHEMNTFWVVGCASRTK